MYKLSDLLSTTSIDDVEQVFQSADEIKVSWIDARAILDVSGQEVNGHFLAEAGNKSFKLGANILVKALLESQALSKVFISDDSLSALGKLKQALSRQKSLAK